MAMNVGKPEGGAEINVVPLIDILLVLLIIFMVISPVGPAGLQARVPVAAGKALSSLEPVVVEVGANGSISINHEGVSWDKFSDRLDEIFAKRWQKVAFVSGEKNAQFSDVARAISEMRHAGITDVGLLTEIAEARIPN